LLNLKLEDLTYTESVLKAEISLYEFYKQAWHILEGATPFEDNWHIQVIAEHLEACFYRQIKRLLINVPPRSGKTSLISIAFPAWAWLHNFEEKFIYASYSAIISTEHSVKCRRLIKSNWYQERWGHIYQLAKDQEQKTFFENNKNGHRLATSVGGSTTARGANILVQDDPNNVKDGDSERKKETILSWHREVVPTRLNNRKKDVMIVVQQRSATNDVSGYITANDNNNEWVKLILPLEYEEARKAKTIVLPSTNGKIWEDPRTKEGEILCSKRWPPEEVERLKREIGTYAFAGQYQQRPAPRGGGILKTAWFKPYKYKTPEPEFVIQSWDTALTTKETSAYSACTTWGIFRDEHYVENIILLSMWKGKLEYPELRQMIKRLHFDYRDTGKIHNPAFRGREINMCLIEAKASGDPLIQDLYTAGIRAIPFNPNTYTDDSRQNGGKERRASLAAALIEAGLVWLPTQGPDYNKLTPFAEEFLINVASFPSPEANDVIDTMTQALLKLKSSRYLLNPRDERPIQPVYKEIKSLY
jgi:predicted phage terminase large subunit-like protein